MKNVLPVIVAIGLVAGAWLAYQRLMPRKPMCPACDRPVMANMRFIVVTGEDDRIEFCCVHCGQHYTKLHPAKIKEALATTFDTGRTVRMEDVAAFVWGSSHAPCCAPPALLADEKIAFRRTWDRCYPSLLPFSSTAGATAFAKEHGGTVLSYAETKTIEKRQAPE